MATETQNPREMLAKMEAEEKAAREKADKLAKENEEKKKALLAKLRDDDLEDVKNKCKLHGFTATDLRGALKTKGKGGVRKTAASKSTARKTTRRKSSKSA
jgi:hypothetical protein